MYAVSGTPITAPLVAFDTPCSRPCGLTVAPRVTKSGTSLRVDITPSPSNSLCPLVQSYRIVGATSGSASMTVTGAGALIAGGLVSGWEGLSPQA